LQTHVAIEYDEYEFQKTVITVDEHGNLEETVSLKEKIEVSRNWHSFCEVINQQTVISHKVPPSSHLWYVANHITLS